MKRMAAICLLMGLIGFAGGGVSGQSGRQSGSERGKQVIHFIVEGTGSGAGSALRKEDFDFFEGGVPQTLESLTLDQSPARIALLVDNTKTLKVDLAEVQAAARALVNELYEGDQMMVVGYDDSPYLLQDFTKDLDLIDKTIDSKFQKAGFPKFFDAISATLLDAFSSVGTEKRAFVLITDGYDDGSQTKFDDLIAQLQKEDITVYVLQVRDRTRNASRLQGPKPRVAIERLTTGTGGRAFPVSDAPMAAKIITEELRLNWFRAVYTPRGVDRLVERNLLIIKKNETGPAIRTKGSFPGRRQGQVS